MIKSGFLNPDRLPPYLTVKGGLVITGNTDDGSMDDGKFGGMSQLANGIRFGINDGWEKNLAVVVNNLGFAEIGFSTQYASKAPAG